MQAIIVTQPGDPSVLQLQERPTPQPGEGEVLISVKAAGVNRPDIAQRKGHYPAPPGAPADIPGLEVAGVVAACGKGVTKWKEGDEICALLPGGGYATHAIAHQDVCLPVPAGCTMAEAASFPETVFTVWHNVVERGQLKPGEKLLVHGGSSGIGVTAIQIAKAMGATIFATAGTAEKCEACEALGAERCINYNNEDFEEVLAGVGMDVVLDMIGGSYFQKNLQLMNTDGRIVFINAMKGAEAALNIIDIMRRRLTITGSTLRNREIAFKAKLAEAVKANVWPFIEQKLFKPVIYQHFPLKEAAAAHQLLESSTHIGKIVLVNEA
ncbi:NAD(P)H-quinone oxidoreductase [Aridibaculum aurantiacum]|uniref:NAD(P)H-quinone oxidoreductase n=1 Tax=Aridibaculum aurantiacum TaxID=2810307 RepID=UPI001A957335|nr:NAD(P)H-quinone oxidoreductase [Aridibaculum aurantiacum]